MLRRLLGTWTIAVCSTGCGVELGIDETRGYSFEIVGSDDPQLYEVFGMLLVELNRGVGTSQFSLTRGEGESTIHLAQLRTDEEGMVGLGNPVQRVVDWQLQVPGVSLTPSRRRAVIHTMNLVLDRDWVAWRIDAADERALEDLRQLLFHEIGHGLGLGHSLSPTSVMYASLGGAKDYEAFFSAVQRKLEE